MLVQGINLGDLSMLFRREFSLCNLRHGETVVLLTDQNTPFDYIAAAFAAASDIGADSYSIGVSRPHDWFRVNSESPGSGKGMMAALKSADLVVTFFPANLTAWSMEVRAAGRDGPRMLLVGRIAAATGAAVVAAGSQGGGCSRGQALGRRARSGFVAMPAPT